MSMRDIAKSDRAQREKDVADGRGDKYIPVNAIPVKVDTIQDLEVLGVYYNDKESNLTGEGDHIKFMVKSRLNGAVFSFKFYDLTTEGAKNEYTRGRMNELVAHFGVHEDELDSNGEFGLVGKVIRAKVCMCTLKDNSTPYVSAYGNHAYKVYGITKPGVAGCNQGSAMQGIGAGQYKSVFDTQ